MRIYQLIVLTLITACGTHPKTEEVLEGSMVPTPIRATNHDTIVTPATPIIPNQVGNASPEASQGSVVPHRMKFRRISEEDLRQQIAAGNIRSDTVLGRYLIGAEERKPTLYYRSPMYPDGWIETQLELVGEWLWNQEVKLDTVRLEPAGPPAVLLTFHSVSNMRHWSTTNEGINIIDLAKEPVLLLKAGTASQEIGFAGDDEEDPSSDNSFEVVQSQSIQVRNHQIIVEPALEDGQYLLHSAPPGTYRYMGGKMIRIGK